MGTTKLKILMGGRLSWVTWRVLSALIREAEGDQSGERRMPHDHRGQGLSNVPLAKDSNSHQELWIATTTPRERKGMDSSLEPLVEVQPS